MLLRTIAVTALAASSISAQAALTTLSAPHWPPVGSTGLETVQFNAVTSRGQFVALGAHAYKNSPLLPNNGVDTFTGQSGIYLPDSKNRANWSFDFSYDMGACVGCTAHLLIDKDPTAGENFVDLDISSGTNGYGQAGQDSWNMEFGFLTGLVYDFDPFSSSSTAFQLVIRDASGGKGVGTNITVNVEVPGNNVPEPGSLALLGLALLAMGAMRYRAGTAP